MEFDHAGMRKTKGEGAKSLLEKLGSADEIDAVLDFMESVAGLVIGGDLEADRALASSC